MTEILTESFCERCGTRYTFEPVDHRRKPLSAIGTLGRGIRHFVSDPGSTLDEAMAVARSESEQRSTATALEAFHRTFNFCLSCRQYTCSDCWNAVEGRCLSCAPTPEAEPPATRVDTAVPLPPMDLAPLPAPTHAETPVVVSAAEAAAAAEWAAVDAAAAAAEAAEVATSGADDEARLAEAAMRADAEAAEAAAAQAAADAEAADAAAAAEAVEAAARAADEAERLAEAAARADAEDQARALAEAEALAAAEAEARAAAEAEALAAEAAARAAAIAEAETVAAAEAQARAAAEAEAEARAAAEADARAAEAAAAAALAFEPGLNLDEQIAAYERQLAASPEEMPAEPEPEPVAAAPEPEPVAVAPEPEPEPVAVAPEPEPEPVAAAPEPQTAPWEPIPTAIGQPLPASVVDAPLSWPDATVAASAFEPNWPDVPTPRRGAGLPAVEPPAVPLAARACPSCGLSLSASARFCRRCGTPQVGA